MKRYALNVARLASEDRAAYGYLADSTLHYFTAADQASRLEAHGFAQVRFRRYLLGSVALHVAERPA
jgi:ubiquinone/menaquinone biosynthesis C-methylase UbiE